MPLLWLASNSKQGSSFDQNDGKTQTAPLQEMQEEIHAKESTANHAGG